MAHVAGSEVVRASIWIQPAGEARDRVTAALRLVHDRCAGPIIRPHLTLLAGIECTRADADRRLKRLAASLRPFAIELGDVGWRNEYFRCLYVNVLLSRELEDAHRKAHEIFEMNPPEPYEPHIGLHYGELDLETRRLLAAEIGDLDVSFDAGSVHLVNAAEGVPMAAWKSLKECNFAPARRAAAGREQRTSR